MSGCVHIPVGKLWLIYFYCFLDTSNNGLFYTYIHDHSLRRVCTIYYYQWCKFFLKLLRASFEWPLALPLVNGLCPFIVKVRILFILTAVFWTWAFCWCLTFSDSLMYRGSSLCMSFKSKVPMIVLLCDASKFSLGILVIRLVVLLWAGVAYG